MRFWGPMIINDCQQVLVVTSNSRCQGDVQHSTHEDPKGDRSLLQDEQKQRRARDCFRHDASVLVRRKQKSRNGGVDEQPLQQRHVNVLTEKERDIELRK